MQIIVTHMNKYRVYLYKKSFEVLNDAYENRGVTDIIHSANLGVVILNVNDSL